MSSFCAWTIVVILYQTVICTIITWLTLECRLKPHAGEAHELTLMKLLYLYDPECCGQRHFYNHTSSYMHNITEQKVRFSTIVWPETNQIAAAFRTKMKLWLSLHIAWLGLALVNSSRGRRGCTFYAALLPLTATGSALLVVDMVHAALFFRDASKTGTESQILEYIRSCSVLHSIKQTAAYDSKLMPLALAEDTTWVSLLFAYASCRGVVQWILNFWIVQDNFFEGLEVYRNLQPNRRKNSELKNLP